MSSSGTRRMSRGGGGASGSVPGTPRRRGDAAKPEDPRPIKTLAWRQRTTARLDEWFRAQGKPQDFTKLTKKMWEEMLKFMYLQIDPRYRFDTSAKDFKNDFKPVIVEGLGYPYAHMLTSAHMATPHDATRWPVSLALLDWMLDVIEQTAHFREVARLATLNNATAYNNRIRDYRARMAGASEVDVRVAIDLEFQAVNTRINEEGKRLDLELRNLDAAVAKLGEVPPKLDPLVAEQTELAAATVEAANQIRTEREALRRAVVDAEDALAELNRVEAALAEAQHAAADLKDRVLAQGIPVDRLKDLVKREAEYLDQLAVLRDQVAEWSKRNDAAVDEARAVRATARKAFTDFTARARVLGLLPGGAFAEFATAHGSDFAIESRISRFSSSSSSANPATASAAATGSDNVTGPLVAAPLSAHELEQMVAALTRLSDSLSQSRRDVEHKLAAATETYAELDKAVADLQKRNDKLHNEVEDRESAVRRDLDLVEDHLNKMSDARRARIAEAADMRDRAECEAVDATTRLQAAIAERGAAEAEVEAELAAIAREIGNVRETAVALREWTSKKLGEIEAEVAAAAGLVQAIPLFPPAPTAAEDGPAAP
ncbi:kinetochore-associated Ndc80 complex subunit ndc80 [Blastocladiella emersonii ATCC 22665]|nr:kinetochore-associated Ndc80 complex subunit ndc80 [Blastocladiella emersonii ATCC 22665]